MAKLDSPAPLETKPPSVRETQGGSVAIFELTQDELRVVRCPDGAVMRSRPREVPVTVSS